MALLSVSFGLRISEALALKWSDLDWLNQTLNIERRIVAQHVDATKTAESQRKISVDSSMLDVLKLCKQTSQFTKPSDWIFASPTSLGRLPWSYAQVWDYYSYARRDAGIGHVSTHVSAKKYRQFIELVKKTHSLHMHNITRVIQHGICDIESVSTAVDGWHEIFNSDVHECWVNFSVEDDDGTVYANDEVPHNPPSSAALPLPANSIPIFARR